MRYKGVLFDLDGTLLDTSGLIIHTFQYSFQKVLNQQISRNDILRYWGVPLAEALQDLAPNHWQELLEVYRSHNVKVHDDFVQPYPYVQETLQELREHGISCSVVSSKLSPVVKQGLRLYGLEGYFTDIIGAEHCTQHKPHPEPVLKGLSSLDLSASECLMVGDTEFDILAAHNAGMSSVAVAWSLLYPQPLLSRAQPTYIINNMQELLKIIKE